MDYNKALELQPLDYDVLISRAGIYADLGEIERAFVEFDIAIERHPMRWEAFSNRLDSSSSLLSLAYRKSDTPLPTAIGVIFTAK
jgi:tetratricopeptide (TPR) repeat protein